MYILFGDEILDSEELKEIIETQTEFTVEKDLSKASKREDILAYRISIDIETLNDELKKEFDIDEMDEAELFDEYMTLSDELGVELEELMPEHARLNMRAYKMDTSDNTIKGVVVISHYSLNELKLIDVTKRLLSQVE